MIRRLVVPALIVTVASTGCSAGFSRPSAEALVERDDLVYAFVDPDPNQNTEVNVPRLQVTADGRSWEAAQGEPTDLEGLGAQIGEDGVAQECHDPTLTCYRIIAPDGGLRLERSATGGQSWGEVWAISAGRLDFQDRCCGSRSAQILDLEFVPQTGLVAVALGEYGLLTLGVDDQIRIDPLGRPERPTSGFMAGLYVEPLLAGFLALVVGWAVTEQRLHRMRNEAEDRFGSAEHTWLTGRARQVPIMLPFAAFLALGGLAAMLARFALSVAGDPAPTSGWVTSTIATFLVLGVSGGSRWLHKRQWNADEQTTARPLFAAARRKALRAHAVGMLGAILTLGGTLGPLIAWSTGTIDQFGNAVWTALTATAIVAAGFTIWEARNPPIPE